MQAPTFDSLELAHKKPETRRERFLERIDSLVPCAALEARIEPSPRPLVLPPHRPYPPRTP